MPVMIQTAGTPGPRRKRLRGADPPPGALVLDVKHLSNPHAKIEATTDEALRLERVKAFLRRTCASEVDRLVETGRRAVARGTPVVVVCLYGRDRSRAIAEMIGDQCDDVYYVHREARLPKTSEAAAIASF